MMLTGTPAEREQAKALLDALNRGIDDDAPRVQVDYPYSNTIERDLLVTMMIWLTKEQRDYSDGLGQVSFTLSPAEQVVLDQMIAVFIPMWQQEVKDLFQSFCRRNGFTES